MRLKLLLTSLLSFLFFTVSFSQQVDLSKPLPTDPQVVSGVLPNGMHYYIRANHKPENRVFLRLVERAGSVCEDDDQQGLAHFTEHMAFNGTKNFPKHQLIKFLESTGMKFGADLNAYTAFDQTVYMLEVPTDKPQYLDTALLILHDWSHYLTMDDDEIDAERGVIREEWRLGRGAQDRMMRKVFPVLLYGSKYAQRLPIGKIDIIENFKHDVLRRFYNDWYRPDLQAVIIVGDIDPQAVKEKIEKLFSQIPAKENPRPRVYPEIPDHQDVKAVVATEKEARYSIVSFYWKHPMHEVKTYGDFRQELISDLVQTMLSARYSEKMLNPKSPYAFAMAANQHLMGEKDAFIVLGIAKKDRLLDAGQELMKQVESARRYGFASTELERAKKKLLSQVEKQYKEASKTESNYFISVIQNHYDLPHGALLSPEQQYQIVQQLLPTITVDDANKAIKQLATDNNMVIVVEAPTDVKVPTEQELVAMVKQVRQGQVEPYKDIEVKNSLISGKIKKGKVKKVETDQVTGATIWTLKNGVRVVIKPTTFKNDQILMRAFSMGGYSLYPIQDLPSARLAATLVSNSGIGDFSRVELDKFLSDKNVDLSPYIDLYSEGFEGQSDVKNLETMLQMVYLYFTHPRFDKDAYQAALEQQRAVLQNKANDPQSVWIDTLTALLSNHSPYSAPLSLATLDKVDMQRAYDIFRERFSDPGSFTFVFVGNIDPDQARPLIEKYLGSLPKRDKKETYRDVKSYLPVGKVVEKEVYKGTDPKSLVFLVYTGDYDYSLKNNLLIKGVSEILTGRFLDTIREAMALTYSIAAYPQFRMLPKNQYGVSVFYSTNPDTLAYTEKKILEISKSLDNGISDKEFNSTIQKLLKEYETNIKDNQYWLSNLVKVYEYGIKPEFVTDYRKIVNSFTKQDLIDAAKKYINPQSFIFVALKPEK